MNTELVEAVARVEAQLWPSDDAIAIVKCGDLRLLLSAIPSPARDEVEAAFREGLATGLSWPGPCSEDDKDRTWRGSFACLEPASSPYRAALTGEDR